LPVLIKNVRVIDCAAKIDVCDDVEISGGSVEISPKKPDKARVIDGRDLLLIPGLIDLHVHFREPGFVHKEDIRTGIRAALAGGVTSVLVMPNTKPSLDSYKRVVYQLKRASSVPDFDLMVAGAASIGLLGEMPTDMSQLSRAFVKAVTDDGRPIMDDAVLDAILRKCRRHRMVFMQHAEDLEISHGAPMNEGKVSKKLGFRGQHTMAEASLIARDIHFAHRLNARYHVLHLSCAASLELVRKAKRDGVAITCEVTPHHLLLDECHVGQGDTCKKMNPPLRTRDDVRALVRGLEDGSIDAVASDHAPHSAREKNLPFADAPFGVVGLESAILVLLTLVKQEGLSLRRAIESMTVGPARVLGEELRLGTMFGDHAVKNAVLIDPNHVGIFSTRNLAGRSKNSPFIGMELHGKVRATFLNGKMVCME